MYTLRSILNVVLHKLHPCNAISAVGIVSRVYVICFSRDDFTANEKPAKWCRIAWKSMYDRISIDSCWIGWISKYCTESGATCTELTYFFPIIVCPHRKLQKQQQWTKQFAGIAWLHRFVDFKRKCICARSS